MRLDVSTWLIKLVRQSIVDTLGIDTLFSATSMSPDEMTDVAINVTDDDDNDVRNSTGMVVCHPQ